MASGGRWVESRGGKHGVRGRCSILTFLLLLLQVRYEFSMTMGLIARHKAPGDLSREGPGSYRESRRALAPLPSSLTSLTPAQRFRYGCSLQLPWTVWAARLFTPPTPLTPRRHPPRADPSPTEDCLRHQRRDGCSCLEGAGRPSEFEPSNFAPSS